MDGTSAASAALIRWVRGAVREVGLLGAAWLELRHDPRLGDSLIFLAEVAGDIRWLHKVTTLQHQPLRALRLLPEHLPTLGQARVFQAEDLPGPLQAAPGGLTAIAWSEVDGRATGMAVATSTQAPARLRGYALGAVPLLEAAAQRAPAVPYALLLTAQGEPWQRSDDSEALPDLQDTLRALRASPHQVLSQLSPRGRLKLHRVTSGAEEGVTVQFQPLLPLAVAPVWRLTARQRMVLSFIAQGATVPETAAAMGRSRDTVKEHLAAARDRLGVQHRLELISAYHAACW